MTEREQAQIAYMRSKSMSYNAIAEKLGLPLNTVKSHCRRNGLTGFSKKQPLSVCLRCGKPLEQPPTGPKRKYCSDECRKLWWKEHPYLVERKTCYSVVCPHCGKNFVTYNHKNQKYCSHTCYMAARFPDNPAVQRRAKR